MTKNKILKELTALKVQKDGLAEAIVIHNSSAVYSFEARTHDSTPPHLIINASNNLANKLITQWNLLLAHEIHSVSSAIDKTWVQIQNSQDIDAVGIIQDLKKKKKFQKSMAKDMANRYAKGDE